MKIPIKKAIFILGLAIGMGAAVSAASASDDWCEVLAVKCSEGNQNACHQYMLQCQEYGG